MEQHRDELNKWYDPHRSHKGHQNEPDWAFQSIINKTQANRNAEQGIDLMAIDLAKNGVQPRRANETGRKVMSKKAEPKETA